MSKIIKNEYQPDFVSPPGETLAETLEFIGMSQSELARRIGRPIKTINEIVNGKTSITPETALQLERAVGVSNRFWLNRESDYRASVAKEAENETFRRLSGWIKRFPVVQMVRYGWIPASQTVEDSARALLSFFGVTSNQEYEDVYEMTRVAFRRSRKVKSNPDAIAAWFRKGVLDAQATECLSYDEGAFRKALDEIRSLTAFGPESLEARLTSLCSQSGVAVVFVRELRGAPVNGATSWLSPRKAMIALSLRHRTNDVLWFSFFHEAAHLLKHSRRAVFVDSGSEGSGTDDIEREADDFASDFLIPKRELAALLATGDNSRAAVENFAKSIGVASGIVVGRLQHEGYLPHSHLNGLKLRLEWSGCERYTG